MLNKKWVDLREGVWDVLYRGVLYFPKVNMKKVE